MRWRAIWRGTTARRMGSRLTRPSGRRAPARCSCRRASSFRTIAGTPRQRRSRATGSLRTMRRASRWPQRNEDCPMARTSNGLRLLAIALGVSMLAPVARADFPERPVKIVVPFDAGGTVDAVARALASRLNTAWNVPVIVENRPGAGNTIGANAVAKAEPDGYTLLFANTSVSVNPSLFKSLPYDTLRDLAPVVYLSPSPNVLLAQKALGIKSLAELITLAKQRSANPLSFASVGKGSAHHFCMELLKSEAGINLLHVPYRGVAPAVLAVTRYVGIMATGGTPPDVVHRLNAAFNEVVREGDFAKHFAAFGYEMVGGSSEEFAAFLKDDIERYRQLTRAAG